MEEEKQAISTPTPQSYGELRERRKRFNFPFGLAQGGRFPQFANRFNFQNLKHNKKFLRYLLLAVILIAVVFGIKIVGDVVSGQNSSTQTLGKSDRITIAPPISTKNINKDFKFSLRDDKGKEISTFTYAVESVELRKEIMVKGQRATAIKGRVFLIINLKLVNTIKQGINVNARDYLRLSVNGNTNELLAPEIHNDPVEVQAISTKYTRVGYAVNEDDRNYILRVGEIDEKKETIKFNFK